jgi:hypothetical protein
MTPGVLATRAAGYNGGGSCSPVDLATKFPKKVIELIQSIHQLDVVPTPLPSPIHHWTRLWV